ncbi:MAG: ASPIC/UnbV domain-containing protein [Acidobacteriota bacterium]
MAAAEHAEQAGNSAYQNRHMSALFKKGFSFSGFERDMLRMNLGSRKFLDISGVSGVDSISDGRGALFADLDNDGDLDIFLTAVQGEAHHLFHNKVGSDNGFLRVELEGTHSGRDAFGTVVRVKTSQGIQTKIKAGGSGFLSESDPRVLFGLGRDDHAQWVDVSWPSGSTQRYENIAAGTALHLVEGRAEPTRVAEQRFHLPEPLDPEGSFMARIGLGIGDKLPDIALKDLSDATTRLRDHLAPGRRCLINIWATYCVPCAEEMPELQALRPGLEAAGIDLLGISIDTDTASKVAGYVRGKNIRYPIAITDEASIARLFPRGEVLIPVSFLVDDQGKIIDLIPGWSASSRKTLHRLAGKAPAAL